MTTTTPRRRPTIAKDWQLAVLKKLHSESETPTKEQYLAVVAETGLDKKWVRNWFTRQRSRNKKDQPLTQTASTFRVQLYYPASTVPAKARTANSPRSNITRTSPSNDPASAVSLNRTTTIPTYSRDPLYHRYPDFSQFFRPQGHQRPRAFELSTFMPLPTDPNYTSTRLLGLFSPLHLGNLSDPTPCPVAFSMRLVDLLVSP